MSREGGVRNTYHRGEKGKSEALVGKESNSVFIMLNDLVFSIADPLVAESFEKLVGPLLNTLYSEAIILVRVFLLRKLGMLVPLVT